MIRLPDEPGTPGAASSGGNPWISEVVTSTSARPGSGGTQARKASLSRLPDDNPAPVIVLSSPQATSRPGSAEQQGAPKTNANAPSKSKLRDRLNKSLTVTTSLKQGERQGQTKPVQAFRQLTEGENINDIYDFGEEIYSGGAKGKVIVAKKRSDNTEVVVKIRTKHSNRSSERTWRAIMSSLHGMGGSQHVLDIIEIVEGPSAFYVVMPKCNGGELFEFLATETEVPESECKRIIREILIAVGHLHKHNLVHRDIKPENIMFDVDLAQASPKTVKLIDFDTCLEWTPATPKSRRFVGTPGYIAPEALLGEISPQSDLWSVGVILYILMTGEMPWSSLVSLEDGVVGSPGATQMYNALKAELLEWEQEPWPDFPLARDLCQKLLAFKVEERLSTVKDALGHPWLRSD